MTDTGTATRSTCTDSGCTLHGAHPFNMHTDMVIGG